MPRRDRRFNPWPAAAAGPALEPRLALSGPGLIDPTLVPEGLPAEAAIPPWLPDTPTTVDSPMDPQLVGWAPGGPAALPAELVDAASSLTTCIVNEVASTVLGYLTFGQSGASDPVTGMNVNCGP